MLDISKLVMPFFIFIIVFSVITYSYHRGYANGTDAQKKKQTAELIKAQDEYMRRYIQLENSQNLQLKNYQDKIKSLEAQHEKNIRELTEENIKVKDAISVSELHLNECMHSSNPPPLKCPQPKIPGTLSASEPTNYETELKALWISGTDATN